MRGVRIALVLAGLAVLPVLAQDDDDGPGFLEGLLENALSGPGFDVDVRGFEGALSSRATIRQLVISDDEGPWLTVNDAVLDWNRSALLRGRVEVEELAAASIEVPRLPTPDPSVPSVEAKPFSLPDLPVSVRIERLAVPQVDLGQPVIGVPAVVSVNGSALLRDGTLDTDLEIARVDDRQGTFGIDVSFDADSNLAIDIAVDEGENGIVANLLNLPGKPALQASVQGQGPLSDFAAELALATDGEPRLTGTVRTATDDGARTFGADIAGDIAPLFVPEYRPFFGPDIALTVDGAQLPDGVLRIDDLSLSARSIDLDGSLVIGADGAPDRIALTGRIASPDGPVVLPVGGEISVQDVDLDVSYDSAQGDDWTARLIVTGLDQGDLAVERLALDGTGRIAGQGESLQVDANLDFTAAGFQTDDPGVAQALGDNLTGNAAIDWSAGAPVMLERLNLNGASVALTGQGQLDPGGQNIPLTLNVQTQIADLDAFSALAGRSLAGSLTTDLDLQAAILARSFDVALDGTAQDLALDIPQIGGLLDGETTLTLRAARDAEGTRVPQLSVEGSGISLEASADLAADSGTARANLRLPVLSVVDPALSGAGTVRFAADNEGSGWVMDLDAQAAGATAMADGTLTDPEADAPLFQGRASVQADDLARFSGVAGRELGGSVDLQITGSGRTDLSDVSIEAAGQAGSLELGQPDLNRLLQGQTELAVEATKNGADVLVPRFSLTNPQITATGEARYVDGAGFVDADVRMAELGDVLPSLSGPATLTLDAQEDAGIWTVTLDGSGAGVRIDGNGTISELDAPSPLAEADLDVTVQDLARFSDVAGRGLGGSLDLGVRGSARLDLSQIDATVDGQARDLAVGQPDLNRLFAGVTDLDGRIVRNGDRIEVPSLALSNDQVRLTGSGQYGTQDDAARLSLVFPDLGQVVPELSGEGRLTIVADETAEAWQVSVDGDGAGVMLDAMADVAGLNDDSALRISGEADLQATDLARFSRVAGRSLGGSVDLSVEGSAQADGSQFDVTANATAQSLRIGIPDADRLFAGRATLALDASRDGADAPIRVRQLNLDAPGVSANASGTLLGGESDLTFDARLADLGGFVPGLNGPVTAQGRMGEAGRDISVDMRLTGPAGIAATVDGTVAQTFGRANLAIDGTIPLVVANPFIEPRSLSGTARANLGLNGPLALSSLSGTVTTSDARAVLPNLSIVLEQIALTARLENGRAVLDGRARKQAGGRLEVSGPISLTPGYDADLRLVLRNLVFEDPNLYRTQADGDITLDGSLTGGARISGRIGLDETEVRIPSTGLGGTGPIPDGLVHVNEPAAVRATRDRAGLIEDADEGGGRSIGVSYPLDVLIVSDTRIFVRGRGLDAELGGRLRLTGTTTDVIPSGQFDLIRGRLNLLGRRLELDEGQITLQGDFVPVVRLVASTQAEGVTIRIIVEGPVSDPDITFASSPDLPQEEVLARLLFGRSLDSISPLQAAQLAQAVATLAGRGGTGIITTLREKTGLDDLDVTTDADGNIGLRAGKYLSENLYTDVTVGASGDANINLNLDLTDNVKVRGGVSNDGNSTLGVFFEKDY
ncbi:hypothetical protein OCGS_1382 [Oceaniovalibus guishaninsula JLT2003]|uniref:Translocation and assembly module TamB C-terminal domain-containing protein n=1 Tax=Oceaniovalibus guishaninsula JLT2003 TaxID=1231392 RepID=K2HNV6_9RHOB|nr:translocation/assembly module TamB domain-containing protein [Oceaniovalibus guishaninsula]EKE44544.1 hypothetical protein OCGS_1382 [Oceaniovalibus guishaninsula JLT2003]